MMSISKDLFTSILNQRQQCLHSELLVHARIPEKNLLTGTTKTEQRLVAPGTESSPLNTLARLLSKRLATSNSVNACSMVIESSWRGAVFFPKLLDVSQRKKYLPSLQNSKVIWETESRRKHVKMPTVLASGGEVRGGFSPVFYTYPFLPIFYNDYVLLTGKCINA